MLDKFSSKLFPKTWKLRSFKKKKESSSPLAHSLSILLLVTKQVKTSSLSNSLQQARRSNPKGQPRIRVDHSLSSLGQFIRLRKLHFLGFRLRLSFLGGPEDSLCWLHVSIALFAHCAICRHEWSKKEKCRRSRMVAISVGVERFGN